MVVIAAIVQECREYQIDKAFTLILRDLVGDRGHNLHLPVCSGRPYFCETIYWNFCRHSRLLPGEMANHHRIGSQWSDYLWLCPDGKYITAFDCSLVCRVRNMEYLRNST